MRVKNPVKFYVSRNIILDRCKVTINNNDIKFIDIGSPRTDFSKIAESSGVKNKRIIELNDFEKFLPEAIHSSKLGEPILIDFITEKFKP